MRLSCAAAAPAPPAPPPLSLVDSPTAEETDGCTRSREVAGTDERVLEVGRKMEEVEVVEEVEVEEVEGGGREIPID